MVAMKGPTELAPDNTPWGKECRGGRRVFCGTCGAIEIIRRNGHEGLSSKGGVKI